MSFSIYLHENGQFWPTQDTNKLTIPSNMSMELSFQVTSEIKLADDDHKCVDEEDYSLTKCLKDYIATNVGCSLNWFQTSAYQTCFSKDEIRKTQDVFDWIESSSWKNVTYITGCFPKCESLKYDVSVVSEEKTFWEKNWISEVFIQTNSANREVVIEYISYDLGDMMGDLGGYLGLFLGWSLLSMIFYFQELIKKCIPYILTYWKNEESTKN